MSRILVLGGTGMLGHKLVQTLQGRHDVYCTMREYGAALKATGVFRDDRVLSGIDAWDMDGVRRALAQVKPDVVINCVGIIKQRSEAKDPRLTIYINALFPHLLAEACAAQGARLIHVSTDCVFSGHHGPYAEKDLTDAEDLYGRTKALGEVSGPGCLTIRTSIIGRDLFTDLSLVDWFLSQAGKRVRGYARVLYTGLTTTALSREIERIITAHPAMTGLYQVSSEPIAKYDLLVLLNQAFGTGTTIDRDDAEVSDRRLTSDRYWSDTGARPASWAEQVAALAGDTTDYPGFRRALAASRG